MKIDGPEQRLITGNLREYISDPWGFVNRCHQQFGHRTQVRMLHQRAYLLSHPDDTSAILQQHSECFKKGRTFSKLKMLLGEGLITSEGELWKRQNRLMRPIFGIKNIMGFVSSIDKIIHDHCHWSDGAIINVHAEMNALTLKIIARTLFDLDLSKDAPYFLKDVEYMMHFLIKKVRSVVSLPLWVPTSENREFHRARQRFDDLVYRLISERRRSAEKKYDLLQILMDAVHEDGSHMSDALIRDEIITTLMAGHETITNSMSWTMMLLAEHPEYQTRLANEAQEFWSDGRLNEGVFNKVNLHQAVLDESMRLWPPVWAFMRQAIKDVDLKGLSLKAGDIVFLMPFFAQRSGDFWKEPLKFLPERFLPGAREEVIPASYFPFGLGPRMCIGKMFAQVEGKLILSHMVKSFRWQMVEKAEQKVEAGITLRPLNNIRMQLKRVSP